MITRFCLLTIRLTLVVSLLTTIANATAAPRVLPEGKLPDDVRLEPLKDLNGYFPFTPPTSKAEWEQRAERVRRSFGHRRDQPVRRRHFGQ